MELKLGADLNEIAYSVYLKFILGSEHFFMKHA